MHAHRHAHSRYGRELEAHGHEPTAHDAVRQCQGLPQATSTAGPTSNYGVFVQGVQTIVGRFRGHARARRSWRVSSFTTRHRARREHGAAALTAIPVSPANSAALARTLRPECRRKGAVSDERRHGSCLWSCMSCCWLLRSFLVSHGMLEVGTGVRSRCTRVK